MRTSAILAVLGVVLVVTAAAGSVIFREHIFPGMAPVPAAPVSQPLGSGEATTTPSLSNPSSSPDSAIASSSVPKPRPSSTAAASPKPTSTPPVAIVTAPKPAPPALPPAAPTSTVAAATSSVPAPPAIAARATDPQSIVGVLCYYRYNGGLYPSKGSGVIVNPNGAVLTARHLVDPHWTAWAYAATLTPWQKDFYGGAQLDHCEIGLPEGNTLPTASEIRSVNPGFAITQVFQYSATPQFIPRTLPGMSDNESRALDFSLLHITGPTSDCATRVQRCDLSAERFPYTPLLYQEMPRARADEVLTFGYPAENINDSSSGFYNFFLKGAVGQIQDIFVGDAALRDTNLNFSFAANDLQSGRSGSALFYKGYVIGVLYGNISTQISFNVSAQAIHALLLLESQANLVSYQ